MTKRSVGDEGLVNSASASPADVAALYDEWAQADYDVDLNAWGYDAPQRVASRVAAHVTSVTVSGTGVLDAGCGTGLVGAALHALDVGGLVGGDFSDASLDVARSRNVYDEVVHLDLNAPLPYAENRFAGAASVGVFSYLTDSVATIRELLRVVAPGGIVAFTQRTDLWAERNFDQLIRSLVATGACTATIADPVPYLPGHPEFGDDIGVIDATLVKLDATGPTDSAR
jgi:predicted TPR repeat methyltransferase